jgi:hypothetical protein
MKNRMNCLENLEGASDHSGIGNDRRDGLKTDRYETISSQATSKEAEGSTSRSWSLSPRWYGGKDPRACGMLLPVFKVGKVFPFKANFSTVVKPVDDGFIFAISPYSIFFGRMFMDKMSSMFKYFFSCFKNSRACSAERERIPNNTSISIKKTSNEVSIEMFLNFGVSKVECFRWEDAKFSKIFGKGFAAYIKNAKRSIIRVSSTVFSSVDGHITAHGVSDYFEHSLVGY